MQQDRLPIAVKAKPQTYLNSTIRIGNWFEERCNYEKRRYNHVSRYSEDFKKKPYTTHPPSVVWNAHIKAEGHSFYPEKCSEEFPNFHDNFSTTYDLSYQYFPKWYNQPIYRVHRSRLQRYDPTEEYLNSYGNLTNYGLTISKQHEWDCEKQDSRSSSFTMYGTQFPSPKTESYKFNRWTRPTAVKSQFGPVHKPFPDNHPRQTNCNPITWDCKDDIPQTCCPYYSCH